MTKLNEEVSSKITVVMIEKENIFQSFFKDLVTLSMIAFCVYISQGSTWWTFVTGGLFLMVSLMTIESIINKPKNVFDNAEDAIKYINDKTT